jgi:hypothetical protein
MPKYPSSFYGAAPGVESYGMTSLQAPLTHTEATHTESKPGEA